MCLRNRTCGSSSPHQSPDLSCRVRFSFSVICDGAAGRINLVRRRWHWVVVSFTSSLSPGMPGMPGTPGTRVGQVGILRGEKEGAKRGAKGGAPCCPGDQCSSRPSRPGIQGSKASPRLRCRECEEHEGKHEGTQSRNLFWSLGRDRRTAGRPTVQLATHTTWWRPLRNASWHLPLPAVQLHKRAHGHTSLESTASLRSMMLYVTVQNSRLTLL